MVKEKGKSLFERISIDWIQKPKQQIQKSQLSQLRKNQMKKINDKNSKNDYYTSIRNEKRIQNRRAQLSNMSEAEHLKSKQKESERLRLYRQKKKEEKQLDAQFQYDYEEDIKRVAKAGKFNHVKKIIDEHTEEKIEKLVHRFYRQQLTLGEQSDFDFVAGLCATKQINEQKFEGIKNPVNVYNYFAIDKSQMILPRKPEDIDRINELEDQLENYKNNIVIRDKFITDLNEQASKFNQEKKETQDKIDQIRDQIVNQQKQFVQVQELINKNVHLRKQQEEKIQQQQQQSSVNNQKNQLQNQQEMPLASEIDKSKQISQNNKEQNIDLYMDSDEQKATHLCHPGEYALLSSFFGKKPKVFDSKALDAGCGDGRFLEFFSKHYKNVDLFDQCTTAGRKVNERIMNKNLQQIATFHYQSFDNYSWNYKKYNMIFLCHTTGYMSDEELVNFLLKAAKHLNTEDSQKFNGQVLQESNAVICILDNVAGEGESFTEQRQRVRSSKEMEKLYALSGLSIAHSTQERIVHEEFYPVKVWFLEKPSDTWRIQTRRTIQTTIEFGGKLDDDSSCDSNGNYKDLGLTKAEQRLSYEIKNHIPEHYNQN